MQGLRAGIGLVVLAALAGTTDAGHRRHQWGCGAPAAGCHAPVATCGVPLSCAGPSCAFPMSCAAPLSCAAPSCAVPNCAGPATCGAPWNHSGSIYGGSVNGYGFEDTHGFELAGPGAFPYQAGGVVPPIAPGDELVF